jgi:oligopeptide/dipeptide ABC transporter ATP-binding protein
VTAPPLLEIRNLTARFRTGAAAIDAVRGVDLAVAEGEVLGIIGESGSGKTVTGLAILRLLPDNAEVAAERLAFHGQSLLALSDEQFRSLRGTHLAMVFQNPAGSFNPAKTIGWHLARVAERARTRRDRANRPVVGSARRLAEVGIPQPGRVLALYPHQLSGGMLQRALIAMVLLLEPDLIIADEPTTNLDNIVERQIIGLFRELRARTRAAIIFITHDMAVASVLADRIAVMYAGEIVETGPTSAVLTMPRHPYTRALIDTALQLEGRADQLREIPGEMPSLAELPQGCAFAPRCNKADAACRAARPAMTQLTAERSVRCIHHE